MNKDKNNIETLFDGLGLGRAEALTYGALLKYGAVSIRKLSEATGINRGTTYEALKRLSGAGLVSTRQQGSREHFTAESPEKLMVLIRDKRRELLELSTAAKELVPTLLAERKRGSSPVVRYYEDDEGIVAILRDVLETCSQLSRRAYVAYSSSVIRHYLYRRFPQFTARRISESIRVQVIAVGEGGDEVELAERKWLPHPAENTTSSYTLIYGNKIATISITPDDMPYGVVIEDAGAAALQQLVFEQLWRALP